MEKEYLLNNGNFSTQLVDHLKSCVTPDFPFSRRTATFTFMFLMLVLHTVLPSASERTRFPSSSRERLESLMLTG